MSHTGTQVECKASTSRARLSRSPQLCLPLLIPASARLEPLDREASWHSRNRDSWQNRRSSSALDEVEVMMTGWRCSWNGEAGRGLERKRHIFKIYVSIYLFIYIYSFVYLLYFHYVSQWKKRSCQVDKFETAKCNLLQLVVSRSQGTVAVCWLKSPPAQTDAFVVGQSVLCVTISVSFQFLLEVN